MDYKIKTRSNGNIEQCKASLTAMGYIQEYGIDYENICSNCSGSPICSLKCHNGAHKMESSIDGHNKCFSQ